METKDGRWTSLQQLQASSWRPGPGTQHMTCRGRTELVTSRVCGTELFSINNFHLRMLWGGYSFHFTNENIASQRHSLVWEPKARLSEKGYVFCPLHQAELTSVTSTRLKSTALMTPALGKLSQGSIWNSVSLKLLPGASDPWEWQFRWSQNLGYRVGKRKVNLSMKSNLGWLR